MAAPDRAWLGDRALRRLFRGHDDTLTCLAAAARGRGSPHGGSGTARKSASSDTGSLILLCGCALWSGRGTGRGRACRVLHSRFFEQGKESRAGAILRKVRLCRYRLIISKAGIIRRLELNPLSNLVSTGCARHNRASNDALWRPSIL